MDKRLAARRMRRERGAWRKGEREEQGREWGIDVALVAGVRKGVITWRQTDSIVNPKLEVALQYHAQGADIGLGTCSQKRCPVTQRCLSPPQLCVHFKADLLQTGCS